LPAIYRIVFLLHDVEGLSNPEIAEALHVTLAAIKSRVRRTRLFLRKRLADYIQERGDGHRCQGLSPAVGNSGTS